MLEATTAGAIGPFMQPLARKPLALIKRQGIRLICPHCQGFMAEERPARSGAVAVSMKPCCKACGKGKKCDGKKKPVLEAKAPKKLDYGTKVRVTHPRGVTDDMDATVFRDLRAKGEGLWVKGPDNRNYRNMELVKILEGVRAVPDCRPVTPPDPDCTLVGGWNKAMRRKGLKLLKKPKKRSSSK